MIFPGWVPWKNLAISQDIPDWIKAQDIAMSYLDAASAQIAAPVTAKYLGKLAAADVFTVDNAFSVFELAVREDEGLLGPFGIQHR